MKEPFGPAATICLTLLSSFKLFCAYWPEWSRCIDCIFRSVQIPDYCRTTFRIFRYLHSAIHVPLSAFRFPLSAFRFPHSALPSRIPLSIQPQSQPHFHLFTFLSSLQLLLLEADSSVLPETLDEPRPFFPPSPPFFRFVLCGLAPYIKS